MGAGEVARRQQAPSRQRFVSASADRDLIYEQFSMTLRYRLFNASDFDVNNYSYLFRFHLWFLLDFGMTVNAVFGTPPWDPVCRY